jgi:hypothetical protein
MMMMMMVLELTCARPSVADHFRYNQESAVVVALPNNVTMARKDVVKRLF